MGVNPGWRHTRLRQELDSREEEAAVDLKPIVAEVMPDAESILNSGTSPLSFSLHDAGHSFRVAERMAEILDAQDGLLGSLDPHDLGMLLLSAYLHDIGMSPELSRLQDHYSFLLTGESTSLEADELEPLQAWLDDEWDGRVPPLVTEQPTLDDLHLVRQILASYVRHMHNDWSADWIKERLRAFSDRQYPGWAEDLILLCRSHHFDSEKLKAGAFDPRLVGNPGTVLHLRFCACLLRIADVLDFDPERTPPGLFAHYGVGGKSAIYWHKDHEIAFHQSGSVLSLHAQRRTP